MKKYICKGLIYQWFNSAKFVILLGLGAWGFIAYKIITSGIQGIISEISGGYSNYFYTINVSDYILLFLIFIGISFIGHGLNKRNNSMFLNSSPYTKKQIKYNEMLCLIMTGVLFIAVFVYVAVIRYINYRHLLSIVEGYFSVIGIEVIKIIMLGIVSVLFIMIVDSMFSSSIAGLICMVLLIPLSFLVMFEKLITTLRYIPLNNGKNIYTILYAAPKDEPRKSFIHPLIESDSIRFIHLSNILIDIVVVSVIIIVLFVVYNKMQKINSLEYSTKIFSSKTNEKIIRILCSVGAGCFASLLTVTNYIDKLLATHTIRHEVLSGLNLIKGLSADILCVVIVAIIANIIFKKILKVVE